MPFLKVDKGLADEADGAQVMKPMPGLDELLARAVAKGMFGTKMRSVIKLADQAGVDAVVDQQFEVGRQILGAGPGADHRARGRHPQPAEGRGRGPAEGGHPRASSTQLPDDQQVMLKLTLPERGRLLRRPRRPPEGAAGRRPVRRLQPRRGQRAPGPQPRASSPASPGPSPRGSSAQQSDDEFDATLDTTIKGIYEASLT